eukprot:m.32447 g.32447  ORF g.32447 m.32447 type:complete len:384 (-) comp16645_c0_seq1:47-1198(-)
MDSPNHLDHRQRGDGKKKRQEAPPPVELGIGPKLKAFSDQKRTILKALASDCKDNSKKGGVDKDIYELLSYINNLPAYVSTSSCSGRVAVFSESPDHKKSEGSWIFVSHNLVSAEDEQTLITDVVKAALTSSSMYYKYEPIILHISCRNLHEGKRLMKVVLSCGFKNSGMLVGKHIMVAVRSTLKLDVPIALDSKLMVSTEYLSMLVKLSNEKMIENIARTEKLYQALKKEFDGDEAEQLEIVSLKKKNPIKKSKSKAKALLELENQNKIRNNNKSSVAIQTPPRDIVPELTMSPQQLLLLTQRVDKATHEVNLLQAELAHLTAKIDNVIKPGSDSPTATHTATHTTNTDSVSSQRLTTLRETKTKLTYQLKTLQRSLEIIRS